MTRLSYVITTHGTKPKLLHNSLYTLSQQDGGNIEVVVIDQNTNETTSRNVKKFVTRYPMGVYYHIPREDFSLSFGFNVGIQRAQSDIIATTIQEGYFAKNVTNKLVETVTGSDTVMVRARCGFVKRGIKSHYKKVYKEWNKLLSEIEPVEPKQNFNSIFCTTRDVWFGLRGYEESLPFAGTDANLRMRIENNNDWLADIVLDWSECQVLHYPHHKLASFYEDIGHGDLDNPNPFGWGEL